MAIELRPVRREELGEYLLAGAMAFGWERPTAEHLDRAASGVELDRTTACVDRGRIVGTTGAHSFRMATPGGDVPTAGVTFVSVLPTHRRRGLLRRMMLAQLEDLHARGEPVAALWASEGGIYGRFGYAIAAFDHLVEIDVQKGAFVRAPWWNGRVDFSDRARADDFSDVYERARARRPGMMDRGSGAWSRLLEPIGSPASEHRFVASYVDVGRIDGYVVYSTTSEWKDTRLPNGTVRIQELVGATPDAEAALWHHCLDRDLVTRLRAEIRPVDDPIRHLLANPHQATVTACAPNLWLRLVDVKSALQARTYAAQDRITIDLTDALCPWNSGRWSLEGGPDGGGVRRGRRRPDLAMDVAALAAVFLGGVGFTELADAGLVREGTPGALTRAGAMFASPRAPWCPQIF